MGLDARGVVLSILGGVAGCALPPLEPQGVVELAGAPHGMVLDAQGRPLVVHESEGQCCRLAGLDAGLTVTLFDVGAGPGVPRSVSDRTWYTLRTAITALEPGSLDGSSVLWTTSLQAPRVAVGNAGALPDGTLVVAVNDDAPDNATNGVNAQLQAVDRFGALTWRTGLGGAFAGELRVGFDDTIYAATVPGPDTSEPVALHALSADGAVIWSDGAGGIPLLPLEDGLLVGRNGVLARVDPEGEEVWTSSAPVAPTSVDARGAIAATRTGESVWVTAPGRVTVVDLATGMATQSYDQSCTPLVAGQDLAMWGVCETETPGRIALTRFQGVEVQIRSAPVEGQVFGAPVLTTVSDGLGASTAYVLYTGPSAAPEPRLVRYPGATNVAPDAPWGEPHGAGNTGAP